MLEGSGKVVLVWIGKFVLKSVKEDGNPRWWPADSFLVMKQVLLQDCHSGKTLTDAVWVREMGGCERVTGLLCLIAKVWVP